MQRDDYKRFAMSLTAMSELYGKSISEGAQLLWWRSLERFDIEQVEKAFEQAVQNPESGQFMPKPADLIRAMQGTQTDRSLIAWGKALDAMQRVGAYTSVCFDDPAIHAAIEDIGGWPKLCRSTHDELPHVQRVFCQTYRAYAARPDFTYPARLVGVHEAENALAGKPTQPPALIGDPSKAKQIAVNGSMLPKTQITNLSDLMPTKRIGREAA
ncbi:DUF6475 domain-containing protein [Methylibium sp.]|uniref:DUF6475 domain-containing protein n=1 Tax=Methylibium sp. TaxID=2067992 RepID=UPI001804505C|nr:DUF6475 domain-containing protein [Methylibium sp.]MBA3590355.1 hypothetical protein [Methylibium sp.]